MSDAEKRMAKQFEQAGEALREATIVIQTLVDRVTELETRLGALEMRASHEQAQAEDAHEMMQFRGVR